MNNAKDLPESYYGFSGYIDRTRMITFWYQLKEVTALNPAHILEIGIGARVIASALKAWNYSVKTFDINESLNPDYVGNILDMNRVITSDNFDVVLCARVLHHLPFAQFEEALKAIGTTTSRYVVLTLPQDTLRVYLGARVTSRDPRWVSIAFPLFVKRFLTTIRGEKNAHYDRLWKVNSSTETHERLIRQILSTHFQIVREYAIPEDKSHRVYVLEKR